MRLVICLITILMLAPATSAQALRKSQRTKYDFNSDWKVFVGDPKNAEEPGFNDDNWKKVTTPYAWNEDDAFRKSIAELSTGVAWYRKHFKLPVKSREQKIFLEFEGIRQAGEFYLNGSFIGRHENGVMAVGLDISDHVRPAPLENVLAVRIDNSWGYREKATQSTYQWNDRNFYANYGGINKNVYLHVTDKLYQTLPLYSHLNTTGVYVYAQAFDVPRKRATITAESQVKNEYTAEKSFTYEAVIEDMDGKTIKTMTSGPYRLGPGQMTTARASASVNGLNFWSWGYGYLYNVHTTIRVAGQPVDSVKTRTGFRKTEFGGGVVRLNDHVIQLKGYAQRTTNEWPAVGLSVPPWMSDFSNRLMVESNANLVRWMHVTPWKQDVESCDRVGLMQAMPAGDSEKDAEGRQWQQRLEVMRDAIIYNRNNPSIIFYESGNKGVSEEHMRQMKELRNKFDPYGGRASGSREMLNSTEAEYGGEMLYINKSAKTPLWAMEYSRDEGLRKYWDEYSPPYHKDGDGPLYRGQNASVYNRNQDSHAIENVIRWYDYWRERPGTGNRVSSGGVNIIFSDSNTHFRGAENYRRSGEVDAMRLAKEGYLAHQVMWDGWIDVERPRTHIIGHWNYQAGTTKNVYVVSNGEKVELFINNVSKGFGEQSSRFLFTFKDIAWRADTIRAVSYNANNVRVSEDIRRTAGAPASIRLKAHTGPNGLRANGADMALIDVEVIDSSGNRCPTALNLITFKLSGPAEWRGGIGQGPENYILSKTLPVEGGINRVIIRSLPTAGKITLTATAEGLEQATLDLVSKSVQVTGGLSLELSDVGLPSNILRGPTPRPGPLGMSRKAVEIVKGFAGANEDRITKSFDDDETTEWSNNGLLNTAWIKYEFQQTANISEIVMKLESWRTRSYPIRITVDERVVFEGLTVPSLGYNTFTFSPVSGRSLKIELTGAVKNRDAFGNIVEVANAESGDQVRKAERFPLAIVEVEIYQEIQPKKVRLK